MIYSLVGGGFRANDAVRKTSLHCLKWSQFLQKKCRLKRDSNSDPRIKRRARWLLWTIHHHGPRRCSNCSDGSFFNIFTCKHSNFFERPKINEMRMGVAHKYFYFHIWQRQANLFFSSVASNLTRIFFVKITFYESLELALMGKMFRCLRMFFQPKKCKNRESEYVRVKWTQIQIFDLNFLLWIKFEWKWWNVFGRRRPNGFGEVRAWDFSSIEVSLQ